LAKVAYKFKIGGAAQMSFFKVPSEPISLMLAGVPWTFFLLNLVTKVVLGNFC